MGCYLSAKSPNPGNRIIGLTQIAQRHAEAPFRQHLGCPAPDTLGAASNCCNQSFVFHFDFCGESYADRPQCCFITNSQRESTTEHTEFAENNVFVVSKALCLLCALWFNCCSRL